MALASTLVIMFLVVSTGYIAIAIFVASGFAFLAGVVVLAHECCGKGMI